VAISGGSIWVLGATDGALAGLTPLGNGDGFLVQISTSGTVKSSRLFGTDQYDYPTSIAAAGRSLFIGGSTEGTFATQANAGGLDGFVMSISNINTRRESKWVREFGTAGRDLIRSLAVSGRAVYVGGETNGTLPGEGQAGGYDSFVVRYSTAGTFAWAQQFGTAGNEELTGVEANSTGAFVAGTTSSVFDEFTGGGTDGFAARFSTTGVQTWLRQFGTPATDEITATAIRSSDNYGGRFVVVGYTGGAVWAQVSKGSDDGFIATFVS
jgi:hypothetical protein